MGEFSWCYCDMGKVPQRDFGSYIEVRPQKKQRLLMGRPGSVLIPEEFGGKARQIDEESYYGYGRFCGQDIYDLVADWNRKWLSEHPEWVRPSDIRHHNAAEPVSCKSWYPFYADLSLSREEMMWKWIEAMKQRPGTPEYEGRFGYREYRSIGIHIACYDDDNAALPFPIKIAKNANSVYENCPPSLEDPYQGL